MKTMRVLIVDDEPAMRAGIVRVLNKVKVHVEDARTDVNYIFEEAGSAEEAQEAIERSAPDLVLLDYKLPGRSGLDVLEWLQQSPRDLLVIMMTAYATIETAVVATKRGAYDFLAKPFTPAELKATVTKSTRHLVLHRQARRLAEDRRQVRFQFISVLAHELKAPLAAVSGYLYLLRDQALGPDVASYVRPVARSLARLDGMQKLVLDLLDLTRIESGRKQRTLAEVDVPEVVARVFDTMQPLASAGEVTLESKGLAEPRFYGDAGELEIVLNNLVSNAVKYNRPGGNVMVSWCRDEGQLTLRVSDTGIGMTPEERSKLFGEFVRIQNEDTEAVSGSGLGLSIVQKLVQLYGGSIDVVSERNRGSVFTVTLPDGAEAQGT